MAKKSFKVVPTLKEILARDKIIKAVLASNQSNFEKSWKQNHQKQSKISIKSLSLEDFFTQTKENKLKKKLLKQNENDIWSEFVNAYLKKTNNQSKHVKNLCKENKIIF